MSLENRKLAVDLMKTHLQCAVEENKISNQKVIFPDLNTVASRVIEIEKLFDKLDKN